MKFSKKLSKVMAMTAMSAMLLTMTASASTVKTPNMGGVSTQYSAMVTAANSFEKDLGNLIVNALSNACYTTAAIDAAIANTNNAIVAINNITLANATDAKYVRDVAGSISTAVSYLNNAGLTGAVAFSLEKEKPQSGSSEFFEELNFKVVTNLYTANAAKNLVTLSSGKGIIDTKVRGDITDQLKAYINLLNAVKAFDQAAGCYDADTTPTPTDPAPTDPTPTDPGTDTSVSDDDVEAAFIEAEDVTIYVGDDFDIMDSAYAEDLDGNDITDLITVEGEVNTAVPGEYDITYSVGGEEVTIVVTVLAASGDAIIDASDLTVVANADFDPMAEVTAIDDGGNGADITELLTVTGTVNTSVPGTYKLSYYVTGENGNQVVKEVTITVEEEAVNAVLEAEDKTILVGEAFDPMEGVAAYDTEGRDTDLTDKVKVEGKVDTAKEGEYQLTYTVTGNSGVEVSKTVTITVVKEIKDAVIIAYDRTVGCDTDFEAMKEVRALDNNGAGKIITGDVEVDGYVDTKVEGDYPITYSVIGSNGVMVTKDVTITVSCDVDNCDEDTTWEDTTWEDTTAEPVDTTAAPVDTTQAPSDPTCVVEPTCIVPVLLPVGWVVPLGTVDANCEPVVNTTCWEVNTTCAPVVNTTCWEINTTCAPVVNTTCVVVEPVNVCEVDTTCAPVVNTTCWEINTTCAPVVNTTCVVVEPVDVCEPVVEDTTCVIVDTTCAPVVDTTCVVVEDTTCVVVEDTTCVVVEDTTCVEVVEDTTCEVVVEVEDTTCEVVEDTTCEVVEDTTCEPIKIVVDPIKVEIIKTESVDTTCEEVEAPVDTTCAPVVVEEVPENTMKPTGANLAELVFSTLSLLGTAVFAKKRR